jgi:hypothetical protein
VRMSGMRWRCAPHTPVAAMEPAPTAGWPTAAAVTMFLAGQ